MTAAAAIVAELGRRGVVLRADAAWLEFDAPRGALADADLDLLRAHKAELLRYLAAPPRPARPGPGSAAIRRGGDPTPGIVVRPDRARMLAVAPRRPEGPGDADESGLEAGCRPIDFAAPDCPAWVDDDSLTFRRSELRAAIEANTRMGG